METVVQQKVAEKVEKSAVFFDDKRKKMIS